MQVVTLHNPDAVKLATIDVLTRNKRFDLVINNGSSGDVKGRVITGLTFRELQNALDDLLRNIRPE